MPSPVVSPHHFTTAVKSVRMPCCEGGIEALLGTQQTALDVLYTDGRLRLEPYAGVVTRISFKSLLPH